MGSKLIQVVPNEVKLSFQAGRELKGILTLTSISRDTVLVNISASGRRRFSISHPKLSLVSGALATVEVVCEALKAKPSTMLGKDFIVLKCTVDSDIDKSEEVIKVPVNFVDQDPGSPGAVRASPPFNPGFQGTPPPASPVSPLQPVRNDSDRRQGRPVSPFRPVRAEDKVRTLQGELEAALEQAQEHTRALYRERDLNVGLRKEIDELKQQLESHDKDQFELELEDSRETITNLEKQLLGAKRVCADYKSQYETVKAEMRRERENHDASTHSMLEEFQSKLRELEGDNPSKIKDKELEIEALSKELQEMTEACKGAIDENQHLQKDIEFVEAERKLAASREREIRGRVAELEQRNRELEDRLAELEAKPAVAKLDRGGLGEVDHPEETGNSYEDEILVLMRNNELLQDAVATLKNELADAQVARESLEELQSLQEDLLEYKEENNTMADEIQFLMREKEHLKDKIDGLQNMGIAENNTADLLEENRALKEHIAELQRVGNSVDSPSLESELQHYKEVNQNLNEDILSLLKEKKRVEKDMAGLAASLNRFGLNNPDVLMDEVESLKSELREVREDLERTKLSETALSNEVDDLRQLKKDLSTQLDFLTIRAEKDPEVITALQQSLDRERDTSERLRRQIDELELELEDKSRESEQQLSELREALERTEDSFSETEKFADSLRRKLESMKGEMEEVEKNAQRRAMAEVVSLRSESNLARKQAQDVLEKMEGMQNTHTQTVEELNAEIARLREQLGMQPISNSSMRNPVEDLKRQVSELRSQMAEKDTEIAELKEEVEEYEQNVVSERTKLELELMKEKKQSSEMQANLESKREEVSKMAEDLERVRYRLLSERSDKANVEKEKNEMEARMRAMAVELKQVPKLKHQLEASVRQQEELAKDMIASVESLQNEAQTALSDKGKMDELVLRLEIPDPRKPGHMLKLRQKPNFTCSGCGKAGSQWGWKCGAQGCQDMLHPECLRRR